MDFGKVKKTVKLSDLNTASNQNNKESTKPINPFDVNIPHDSRRLNEEIATDTKKEDEVDPFNKKEEFHKEANQFENKILNSVVESVETGEKTIVDVLDVIVESAYKSKASDIHIEATEVKVIVRFRIDGLLRDIYELDKSLHESLIFRVKVAAKLRTDEHFAPQDGKIRFKLINVNIILDTRVSILPTTKGEKVVMRLLSKADKNLDLSSLGLIGSDLEKVRKSYAKPHGMILATGPTGSGKTTTLYSILSNLNSREKNITTIEDPVEYDIEGVNHIQINAKAKLTFANGLRSILRQDPDIVMVGEIRDKETAKIAINAAMTGHLLLSTLHTNDAVTTIPRLIDMGIDAFLVASTVNIIVAQRLARKLCSTCKLQHKLTSKDLEGLKQARPDIETFFKSEDTIFEPKGCKECNFVGYKGRVGLYEVLEVNESIRKIIVDKTKSVDDIFKKARENGLILIVEDGVEKVKQGITSINELQRVTAIKE
jgi:type II secretory ATPase GspE/PulE/Tfp pilus assembly ATPase PilB-like protein